MTTASKITLVRVFLIPVYLVFMLLSANGAANDWMRWVAIAVFIVASISDFLDGYIARHYNQVSDFGKFLDPLADKLLVTACMMVFVLEGDQLLLVHLIQTCAADLENIKADVRKLLAVPHVICVPFFFPISEICTEFHEKASFTIITCCCCDLKCSCSRRR